MLITSSVVGAPAALKSFAISSGECPTPTVLPSLGNLRSPSLSENAANSPILNGYASEVAAGCSVVAAAGGAVGSAFFAHADNNTEARSRGTARTMDMTFSARLTTSNDAGAH